MAPLRAKNASDHFRAATAAIALVASAERFDVLNQALLIKLVDQAAEQVGVALVPRPKTHSYNDREEGS
jgi:hypothetical protein